MLQKHGIAGQSLSYLSSLTNSSLALQQKAPGMIQLIYKYIPDQAPVHQELLRADCRSALDDLERFLLEDPLSAIPIQKIYRPDLPYTLPMISVKALLDLYGEGCRLVTSIDQSTKSRPSSACLISAYDSRSRLFRGFYFAGSIYLAFSVHSGEQK